MADHGEADRRSVVSSSSKVTKERLRRAIPLLAPVSVAEDSSAEELWFDLLLDLALASTYSNLTSNTSVYTELDAVSYLGFFLLLWWIWTSQVCYNARFRQNDWIHRIYLILQLCVFGALSTFTANFDVTDQILDTGGPDSIALLNATFIGSNDYTSNSIILDAARRKQLPPINNRGISGALGCSRLILLVPYLVVWWRSRKFPKPNTSVVPIICSLIFSSAMHFTTYGLLTTGGREQAIAKVVLWYSSILIEITAHYIDIGFPVGRSYPMGSELFNRASTLMTVIIGEGVNAITGAFHYIVGNVGINAYTLFNMVCTAAIIFCQFTLYFEGGSTPSHQNFSAFSKLGYEGSKRWNRNFRALTWLIAHALYFACLILFMQSVTSILAFQNLQTAADQVYAGLHQVEQIIVPAGVSAPTIDETGLANSLSGLGVPWPSVKEFFTNTSIPQPERMNAYLKFEGELYWYLASLFGSTPEPDSDQTYNFQVFISSVNVTQEQYRHVLSDVFTPRARSTLWLPGSSGGTLIALGLLNAVQRHPPDIYAWLSLFIRMSVGAVVVLSTLGNNGSEPYPLFDDPTSAVWRFLKSGWLLPALAAIYIVQVIFDYVIVYAAVKRAKASAKRKSQRASAARAALPGTPGGGDDPDEKEPDPSIAASPDYGDPPPFSSGSGKFIMTAEQLERNGMTGDLNTPSDDNPNYNNDTGLVPIIASPLNPRQRKLLSKQDSSSRASSSMDGHTPTGPPTPRPTSRLGRQVSIVETPKTTSRRQSFGESASAPASRRPSMSGASSDGEQRPSRSYLTADSGDEPQPSRSYANYANQASGSNWSPPETIGSGTVPGAGRPSLLEQAAMSPKLDRRQSNKLERKQSGGKLEKREKRTTSDGASSMWPSSEMTRTPSRKLQRRSGAPQEYPVIDRPQATYNWD